MTTQNTPRATSCLRHATAWSRRCRGIEAARQPTLTYLLGCYLTWQAGMTASLDQRAPRAAVFDSLRETSDPAMRGLMRTLRRHLAVSQGVEDAESEEAEQDAEAWLGHPTPALEGVDQAEVLARIQRYAKDPLGYWLLGRLEALVGMRTAWEMARTMYQTPDARLEAMREAIRLQRTYLADAITLHPAMDALVVDPARRGPAVLCVEGLDDATARIIVREQVPSTPTA